MIKPTKFIEYSPYYLSHLEDEKFKKYLIELFDNDFVKENPGYIPNGILNDLHPLFFKEVRETYDTLKLEKLQSFLNRNRFLSCSKKGMDNSNYRSLFYKDFVFKTDFETHEDYLKALKKAQNTICITPYGACDSVDQIKSRLNFLNRIKNRSFFIEVSFVQKENIEEGECSYGGYRQHKNGGYYGTKKLEHEYLADEKEIDEGIYQFHIKEFIPVDKTILNLQEIDDLLFLKERNQYLIFDKKDYKLISYLSLKTFELGSGLFTIKTFDSTNSLCDIASFIKKDMISKGF